MPPSTKNTNVRTRYMIPIRLWSVVMTQSIRRLVWRGRATPWAITWGTGLRTCSVVTDIVGGALEVSVGAEYLAQLCDLIVGGLDQPLLVGHPLRVLRGREHGHERGHEGMLAPAQ